MFISIFKLTFACKVLNLLFLVNTYFCSNFPIIMPISTSDMKGGTRITKQDLKNWCIHPMKNAFARANSRLFALNSQRWLVFLGAWCELDFFLRYVYYRECMSPSLVELGVVPKTLSRCVSSPVCAKSFDEFLGLFRRKRLFLSWVQSDSDLFHNYMPRCLFKMYIFCFIEFYWVRFVAPLECDQAFFVLETKPVTQVNIATSEGLGLRQDSLLFPINPTGQQESHQPLFRFEPLYGW